VKGVYKYDETQEEEEEEEEEVIGGRTLRGPSSHTRDSADFHSRRWTAGRCDS